MGTWVFGILTDQENKYLEHDLPAILERWKISKLAYSCRGSGPLFKIIETPLPPPSVSTCSEISVTPMENHTENTPESCGNLRNSLIDCFDNLRIDDEPKLDENEDPAENFAKDERKSQISRPMSLTGECKSSFEQLLLVCRQSTPLTLSEVISQYWLVLLPCTDLPNLTLS